MAVDRQLEAGEKPRVYGEQTFALVVEVTDLVADAERGAFEYS